MSNRSWFSKNFVWVVVAILAANFLLVYWGTINLGLYGFAGSILGADTLQRKKVLVQEQAGNAVSSSALRLTCGDDDIGSAFASVRPAVVSITATRVTPRRGGSLTSSVVFDNPAIKFVQEPALGSGIIVDQRGYIVTNAHVVSKAEGQDIKVVTFGFERTEYSARVVRKDLPNDIAILKIDPEGPLPAAVLGDSDMIRVADRVMAVGSPFGLEHTVTAGIISDDSRNLVIEDQTYEDMIQTDAAINAGNSGGPLVNMSGEVIGINTAIYAPTGVFTGVGFAIPINRVKPVLKDALSR